MGYKSSKAASSLFTRLKHTSHASYHIMGVHISLNGAKIFTSNLGIFLLVPPSKASTGRKAIAGPFISTKKFCHIITIIRDSKHINYLLDINEIARVIRIIQANYI